MINELTTLIRLAGEGVLRIITWPGELALAYVADLIPGVVETLVLQPGNSALLYAVSLLAWLLLFLFVRGVFRFVHNLVRLFGRIRTFIRFRLSMAVMFGKRRIDGLSAALRIWRHPEEAETPHVEFEDQDLAVLDAVLARGPGFAVSAPELTEQMKLRPSQVQRSLDKLRDNALLQLVIGSTDGYDNYGVTPIGAAFMQSWLRQSNPGFIRKTTKRTAVPDDDYIPDGLHLQG